MKTKLEITNTEGKHCCKQCSKEIQYITSNRQEFCSNACRSRFNQLERAMLLRRQRETRAPEPTQNVVLTPQSNELAEDFALIRYTPTSDKMSIENLCSLLDTVLAELAEEKTKATIMERELSRFKKVAFNVYYTQ